MGLVFILRRHILKNKLKQPKNTDPLADPIDGFWNYLKYLFNRISLCSRFRALHPVSRPITRSETLVAISSTLNVSSVTDVLLPVRGLPEQPAAQEGHVPLVQGHADQVNAYWHLMVFLALTSLTYDYDP